VVDLLDVILVWLAHVSFVNIPVVLLITGIINHTFRVPHTLYLITIIITSVIN
jgi:hypothetical protein